jgi:hypothetical protein
LAFGAFDNNVDGAIDEAELVSFCRMFNAGFETGAVGVTASVR